MSSAAFLDWDAVILGGLIVVLVLLNVLLWLSNRRSLRRARLVDQYIRRAMASGKYEADGYYKIPIPMTEEELRK